MGTASNLMEEENKTVFFKRLMKMVLPIAFQNFMTAAVNASDAVMLGVIDQSALSAVSLAGQILFVFTLFMMVITISTTILAAQYWGKGEYNTVEMVLAFAMKLSVCISLVFFAATAFFPQYLMRIFTTDQQLITLGAAYLRIISPTFLLMGISQVYLCIMKNSGKTTRSTLIGSSAMLLNILFNAVLIYGLFGFPALGLRGAAIATLAARIIETLWAIIESFKKDSIKVRLKFLLHIDKSLQSDYIKNSLPVFANYLVWGIGFTMYSVIMGHLGSDAVAAHSLANIMKNLVICICTGIGTAGSILVGNELGRGNIDRAIAYGTRVTKLAIISGFAAGAVLLALIPLILNLADLTPTAKEYLLYMLLMCCYYVVGKSVNSTTIGGIFCAGGDAKFGFHCDLVIMWFIMVPLGMLAAFVWKLPVLVVYFILSLDEFIKLPAVYRHYKKYKWAKDLTRRDSLSDTKPAGEALGDTPAAEPQA